MPTTVQIENADVLTAPQALRLIAAVRASDRYREYVAAYPDVEATIKAKINRRKTITGATNASPIVITAASHGFAVDDVVTVQSVAGNTAANGAWLVSAVTTDTLTLLGATGNASYTSGGEVLDLASQHLAAIVAALDEIGDGTVAVKGGRQGADYSQVRDRESLIAEALDLLYSIDSGEGYAVVASGQRGYADRICHEHGTTSCGCPRYVTC